MLSVKWDFVNRTRRNDHSCYGFVRFKRATAIYVLAWVIALLCLFRKIATTFCMGGGKA